jgi:pre-mRNA-splicing helicase BRR2
MDIDVEDTAAAVPKTVTLAPGSTVQPKMTVDLESMAFSQGGHLMSNKKCRLPNGSFKRSQKGFEEIHVATPKKHTSSKDELVLLTELSEWTWAASTVPKLNRVQRKLFPGVFGITDLLLLCVPTGTGKVSRSIVP